MVDNIAFTNIDKNGLEKTYIILDRFTKDNKNFIIYQEKEKEDLYAALYESVNDSIKIIPIEEDKDYDIVDEYLENI